MAKKLKNYRVTFTVIGEVKVKKEIVQVVDKSEVKNHLIANGYMVDEIVSCYEK